MKLFILPNQAVSIEFTWHGAMARRLLAEMRTKRDRNSHNRETMQAILGTLRQTLRDHLLSMRLSTPHAWAFDITCI